jgi:glucose/arabinose dehydrogenase
VLRALGFAVALTLLAAAPAAAAPRLQSLGSFDTPVGIAGPPGDGSRVMVVEKGGTVRIIRNRVKVAEPFLDLSAITASDDSERGLLSIAFPPDYQQTGLFYVFLTAKDPLGEIQIRELRRTDADHAAPGTGRLVFSAAHGASNHNGGQLQFGPDGMLWFTIGDDADAANAQDTSVPYGKLNRIDPHPSAGRGYTVPGDNPFANTVWAYGLRNPWRFSFDRNEPHDLIIGDVGDVSYEEIDFASAASGRGRAANYGWPCREGLHAHSGTCAGSAPVNPVLEQSHDDGWAAIIGGYIVRDPGLPSLAGRYLYGDFNQQAMRALDLGSGADAAAGLTTGSLTALGEDACGHLYTASYDGDVSQIVDGAPSACPAGTTPVPTTPTTPAADTTPCTLRVTARNLRTVTVRRYLRLTLRSNERCRLTISGRVPGLVRFRTLHRTVQAGTPRTVKLRLTRAANRKLRHAVRGRRSRQARLRVRGVDVAGNERRITRRVRIRR